MPAFLRALNSRNYRLYFVGQLISLAGTWMQQIAMAWLAYRLSNSAFVLGSVGFASQIPILFFSAFAGVWSDRVDRRRLLLLSQSLSMVQALVLAVLAWMEWITPGLLIFMALCLGCINALDVPARQAIAVQLVDDKEDLPNAIALNSFLMNAARFVGPALAGYLVVLMGEAVCFLLNALSYLAVLLALSAIRLPAQGPSRPAPALDALKEGISYVRGHGPIRRSLLLVSCISFLATPYAVMMPLFAKEIFGGDAGTFGLLMGCAGAGSLVASFFLASRRDTGGLEGKVALAAPAVGAALTCFALSPSQQVAYPIIMSIGFCVIITIAGSNTLIQTRVNNAYRGRVMAIFSMAFLGIAPLGSFIVGSVAHQVGIRPTLAACGLLTLAAGLVYRRLTRAASAQEPVEQAAAEHQMDKEGGTQQQRP
ncbi:MFS transporter [Azospira oryzae]|uniref:MFS transporter n=1 Tax=Azospira oryzae TaxID=146939 RepID=UPI0019661766|nr:MFS transporter [Azospira oryzae]